jgi:glutathione synthase/RimK-type ligase-like ATP-grasp enzyme
MKKIGVLFGVENSFPSALVERINARNQKEIEAEYAAVGAVQLDHMPPYAVIVDRISHEVPFYRSFLKHAALHGTAVINDPFRLSADDKFLNCTLAMQLGVAVPPTVLLPHKQHPGETTERSLRNLEYPLDWEGIFAAMGEHGFLKPIHGGGWRDVHEVRSREEFFAAYDKTRDLCMIYQQAVEYTAYFRCIVVGQKKVLVMPYDPQRPAAERYLRNAEDAPKVSKKVLKRIEEDAMKLCAALDYDLNSVEFAVKDDVPYAIDFMNPVPDADVNSVGEENFEWIVNAVADLAIERAKAAPSAAPQWTTLAERESDSAVEIEVAEKKPKAKAAAKKAAPKKKAAAK